jgi:alpha-tubulin suppressor-like RCC1 family protein
VCARLAAGTVQCWGSNNAGELGDGTTNDSVSPLTVTGLSGVTQVEAGNHATCAVLNSGSITCWGANDSGQLGNPTAVPGALTTVFGF